MTHQEEIDDLKKRLMNAEKSFVKILDHCENSYLIGNAAYYMQLIGNESFNAIEKINNK